MKIKEISLNDLIAIVMASIVIIVAMITNIPKDIIPVLTAFLGIIGGYIGARNLTANEREKEESPLIEESPIETLTDSKNQEENYIMD